MTYFPQGEKVQIKGVISNQIKEFVIEKEEGKKNVLIGSIMRSVYFRKGQVAIVTPMTIFLKTLKRSVKNITMSGTSQLPPKNLSATSKTS